MAMYRAHRTPEGHYVYRGVLIERTEVPTMDRYGRYSGKYRAQFYINYPGIYLPEPRDRYAGDSYNDTLAMLKEYVESDPGWLMATRTFTYWIARVYGDPLNSIRGRTKSEVISRLEAAGAVKQTARAQGIGGAPGALVHTWDSMNEDISWANPAKQVLYYDGDLLSLIEEAFSSEIGY